MSGVCGWYGVPIDDAKSAIEMFYDSDGDGCGDLFGLTERVDYLAGLGVSVLWLMPFYPSPNRDDGYDITDFYAVDSALGTLGDFVELVRTCRDRGIRVISIENNISSRCQSSAPGRKVFFDGPNFFFFFTGIPRAHFPAVPLGTRIHFNVHPQIWGTGYVTRVDPLIIHCQILMRYIEQLGPR